MAGMRLTNNEKKNSSCLKFHLNKNKGFIWRGYGENLCPLLQSTVLAAAGGEKAAGL